MGAWGVAIFSDDLAADLRDDFRELIGEGLSSAEAVDRLTAEYASSLEDANEMPVFWLALAAAQWKLGRLDPGTSQRAMEIIDSGLDLARWDDPAARKKRAAVLEKTRAELLSPQPEAKRVPRTIKEANEWSVGEVLGLRLRSGKWTLIRVIGHHTDKGGRSAVCELLDWVGDPLPTEESIRELPIRVEATERRISQFLLPEPRKKADQLRLQRLGVASTPAQQPGGYTALPWSHLDQQLENIFGLV